MSDGDDGYGVLVEEIRDGEGKPTEHVAVGSISDRPAFGLVGDDRGDSFDELIESLRDCLVTLSVVAKRLLEIGLCLLDEA